MSRNNIGWKILSLVLALIIIVGVITGVVFWQKGNIEFHPIGQAQQNDEENEDNGAPVIDENGEVISSDTAVVMPTAMTFRSAAALDGAAAAYDSVTVKASVNPSNADVKACAFSAEWASDTEWATGKEVSDYLTVTQAGKTSLEAEIQCLKPFGEQIEVTVTVTGLDDVTKSATCTVDFAQRLDYINFYFSKSNGGKDFSAKSTNEDVVLDWDTDFFSYTIVSSAYTVVSDFEFTFDISIPEETLDIMRPQFGASVDEYADKIITVMTTAGNYKLGLMTNDSSAANALKQTAASPSQPAMFSLDWTCTNDYSNYSGSLLIRYDRSTVYTPVSSVTLDQSNIIV